MKKSVPSTILAGMILLSAGDGFAKVEPVAALRLNYSLRYVPEIGPTHGFGVGFKAYTTGRNVNDSDELNVSGELAFDATFGERNMYALGLLGGSGVYTPKAEAAFELEGSLLRAAIITSPTQIVWNPSVGLELKLGSVTATPSLQGYVGTRVKGVGFGFNGGFSFQ